MIIEIKNLPEGRKVKHINVDISFEEDGPAVEVKTDTHIELGSERPHPPAPPVPPPKRVINEDLKPSIPETRETKPIPDEMKDLEF